MAIRALAVALIAGFAALHTSPAYAEDWPQWRGPDGLGIWEETGILESFPEEGLDIKWRVPIGSGYSGPVVADGRVVTMDYAAKPGSTLMEALERVICLDEETGEILWTDEYETHYREIMASYQTGPRGTPVIDGDRVYGMGAAGDIRALDLKTGELLWSKDSRAEWDISIPIFGISGSPIVEGDVAIFVTGGSNNDQVKGFDKMTGELLWGAVSTDYEMGYSQPVMHEIAGVRQLIFWDPKGIHSMNPKTGEFYWQEPLITRQTMTIATPVKDDNKLLVSSFYSGSVLYEINEDGGGLTKIWEVGGKAEFPNKTKGLHSVITTPIIEGDMIYSTGSYGEFRGIDLTNSDRVWLDTTLTRQGRWSSVFFVKNGDRYFMNNDSGELLIIKFDREGATVIDRTMLIEPDTDSGYGPRRFYASRVNWVHPAYANGHIIVRNDGEILRASLEAN